MSFRKMKGVKVPYNRQGLIYFTCRDYKRQPGWMQEKIQRLCESAGGEYAPALFELVTRDASVTKIALKYHCDESAIYRVRRKFYESW